jgi:hypothetical protein
MKRDVATLLEEALALPAKDRTALAEALLVSLDGHPDDETDAAWKAEIEGASRNSTRAQSRRFRGQKCGVVYSSALVVEPFDGCAMALTFSGCQ